MSVTLKVIHMWVNSGIVFDSFFPLCRTAFVSNFKKWNLVLRMPCFIQSIVLDVSVSSVPALSTIFYLLSHGHLCTLSAICLEKNVSEILIRTVLHFLSFYIISSLLFLKVRAKYQLIVEYSIIVSVSLETSRFWWTV